MSFQLVLILRNWLIFSCAFVLKEFQPEALKVDNSPKEVKILDTSPLPSR